LDKDIFQDDPGFLTRLIEGNEQVFVSLHQMYRVRLIYFVLKMSLSSDEAEDIVAETFLKLWQSRSQITSALHVRNFLYATARHGALNLLDYKQRQKGVLQKYGALQETTQVYFSNDRVETEMVHLLHSAVKELPSECRKVFQLYLEDLRPEEIAEQLSITPATVRSQKRRAILLLKKWLNSHWTQLVVLLATHSPFLYFLKIFQLFAHSGALICN
jgi:RNA polymerase sigma factor (sigma-70 family)